MTYEKFLKLSTYERLEYNNNVFKRIEWDIYESPEGDKYYQFPSNLMVWIDGEWCKCADIRDASNNFYKIYE